MQVRFTDGTNTFVWKACRQVSLGWKAVQKDKTTEVEKKEDGDEQVLSSLPDLTEGEVLPLVSADRKSTRLNSSHANISYAVFCLKKKKIYETSSHRSSSDDS